MLADLSYNFSDYQWCTNIPFIWLYKKGVLSLKRLIPETGLV
jgi:hypothetical protein